MIPLVLITGFLGSGKTSVLLHLARSQPGKRFVFLVNEFSPKGVDPVNLRHSGMQVLGIEGGSIFCKCKVTEFIDHLGFLATELEHSSANLDALIIETSGLADPRAIHRLLRETGLDKNFHLQRIISIAVAGRLIKLAANLPVIESQIRTSDTVILNKEDLSTPEEMEQAESLIRNWNKECAIIRTSWGVVPFTLTREETLPYIDGPLTESANPYSTIEIPLADPVDPDWLVDQLNSFEGELLRAKGFIPTPEGSQYLDWTEDGHSVSPAMGSNEGIIVLIVRDAMEPQARQFADYITQQLNKEISS